MHNIPDTILSEAAKANLIHSKAKRLTDYELSKKLRSLGIRISRSRFKELSRRAVITDQLINLLLKRRTNKTKRIEQEYDWVWICLRLLWRRWCPNEPCMETMHEKIQNGYELVETNQHASACHSWLAVRGYALLLLSKIKSESNDCFEDRYGSAQSLFDWFEDLSMALFRAGLEDKLFVELRIDLCNGMLLKLDAGSNFDKPFLRMFRLDLAQSYCALGKTDQAVSLFLNWLQNEPTWGMGWIGWFCCYFLNEKRELRDLDKCEKILKDGLSIPDVTDRVDLIRCLAILYDELKRRKAAEELRRSLDDYKNSESGPERVGRRSEGMRSLFVNFSRFLQSFNEDSMYQETQFSQRLDLDNEASRDRTAHHANFLEGLDMDQRRTIQPKLLSEERHLIDYRLRKLLINYAERFAPSAVTLPKRRRARKELCPCGSGRRYKRCCSRLKRKLR